MQPAGAPLQYYVSHAKYGYNYHQIEGRALHMDGRDNQHWNAASFDMKPYWDLYTSGDLVLLAFHSCEAGQKPVITRYSHVEREYKCPSCGARHATRVGADDHPLSPSFDRGYYVGYGEPPIETPNSDDLWN
jgi:hypothetical protein